MLVACVAFVRGLAWKQGVVSQETLKEEFKQHAAAFDSLAEFLRGMDQNITVFEDGSLGVFYPDTHDLKEVEDAEVRTNLVSLVRDAGLEGARIWLEVEGDRHIVSISPRDSNRRGVSWGYVFSQTPPGAVIDGLDRAALRLQPGEAFYHRLANNWYIYVKKIAY